MIRTEVPFDLQKRANRAVVAVVAREDRNGIRSKSKTPSFVHK
jgi:hypothetical protein